MAEPWMRVDADAGGRWFADLRSAAETRADAKVEYEPAQNEPVEGAGSPSTSSPRPPRELTDLLFCQTCKRILTRHPRDVVDEIDAYYCPHSLDNMTSSEAMSYMNRSPRFFDCPVCQAVLSTRILNTAHEDTSAEMPAARFFLACSHCQWDSVNLTLVASSPEELITLALQREKENDPERTRLFPALTKHFSTVETELGLSSVPSPEKSSLLSSRSAGGSHAKYNQAASLREGNNGDDDDGDDDDDDEANESLWRWEDADRAARLRSDEALLGSPDNETPDDLADLLQSIVLRDDETSSQRRPKRSRLRIKRSIRCRKCMDANQDNILVKGQINPLKGDSSIRTNVGQWFKKKSLAYDFLPRIAVIAKSHNDGGPLQDEDVLTMVVTNPRDVPVELSFDHSPPVLLDAFDDVEEMDLITAAQPPKPSQPREKDPKDLVLARFFNKVLLRLPASPSIKTVRVREQDLTVDVDAETSLEDDASAVEFRIHITSLSASPPSPSS
ncbi:Dynactin subunit 4 [Hondaea fermentalgiana]|uniref:Dynactin subunit 4 n=1 Tax=Hondaea fermentalgiana TaxID=2315210 RepID=A0A2R5GQU6_9STRA|nr:Dynactin subunit 4 [Hondaea fermentalgiana]|eukprot:GBG33256.1 Dynactin subunit 4 [Hondaea fermentalgiana]